MKEYYSTRRIDDLGRVVIPKEIRKKLNIKTGDRLEVYLEDNEIKLLKPVTNKLMRYIVDIEYMSAYSEKITRSEYGQLCAILNKLKEEVN